MIQADALLMTAPMYNFQIPSMLKAWFDHIARAGVTFTYTAEGPKGLLVNKPVYVITTRGGQHQGQPTDTITRYLKTMLVFVGLEQVHVIYSEGLAIGKQGKKLGMESARQQIQQLFKDRVAESIFSKEDNT